MTKDEIAEQKRWLIAKANGITTTAEFHAFQESVILGLTQGNVSPAAARAAQKVCNAWLKDYKAAMLKGTK